MSDPVGFAGGSDKPPKKKRGRKKSDNARLKLYAKGRAKGLSKKDAALEAGFSESVAENAAQKIERPNQEYFERLMDRYIPDELIARKVREGLDATVVKTATYEGQITDEKEYADMPTRARYVEIATELKGRTRRHGGDTTVNLPVMLVHAIPRPERAQLNGHSSGQVNGNKPIGS